jgi:acetyl esterase
MDAETRAIVRQLHESFPRVETMTGPQARAATRAARPLPVGEGEAAGRVVNQMIPGPAGELPIRVYEPAFASGNQGADGTPFVVFYHGGGFVLCDLESHDAFCRDMCRALGAVVVSVDYRLAPEHPFPAAAEDGYAAATWARQQAAAGKLPADPTRGVLAGDSSGGNTAAVVAHLLRDRGDPAFACQLLIYPVIEPRFDTSSYEEFSDGYVLTRTAMQWYWQQYAPDHATSSDPYLCPLWAADLGDLPPAVIITASHDPLRDEGEAYARALEAAGTPTALRRVDNAFHSFFTNDVAAASAPARAFAWDAVRRFLAEAGAVRP